MVSEIVARVCGLVQASDRFDCLFGTMCSWLATLSLVCMKMLTLDSISSSYDQLLVVGANTKYDSEVWMVNQPPKVVA